MDILGDVNLFIETYLKMIRGFRSLRLIAPFLILALIKAVALSIIVSFYLPPVHKILIPILSHFYTDYALHFPRYYLVLPQIYNYASTLIIDLLFGVILYAAAVFCIGTSYKKERGGLGEGVRTALKSFGALAAIWIIKAILVFAIFKYCPRPVFQLLYGLPFTDLIGYIIIQILSLVIIAFLIYSVPAIMLQRRGLAGALIESLRFASRHFMFTFFLIFVPWLIQLPFDYVIFSKIHLVLAKFNYAAVIYLLGFNILITMVTGYLLYAGITYFYIIMTE